MYTTVWLLRLYEAFAGNPRSIASRKTVPEVVLGISRVSRGNWKHITGDVNEQSYMIAWQFFFYIKYMMCLPTYK